MVKTVTADRYFPATIFPTDTGAVRMSWSVFCLRSSLSMRMVRIGTVISRRKTMLYMVLAMLA